MPSFALGYCRRGEHPHGLPKGQTSHYGSIRITASFSSVTKIVLSTTKVAFLMVVTSFIVVRNLRELREGLCFFLLNINGG
jgi:hypothetical protein